MGYVPCDILVLEARHFVGVMLSLYSTNKYMSGVHVEVNQVFWGLQKYGQLSNGIGRTGDIILCVLVFRIYI